jgi:putative aminopeptidase FrvX
MRELIRRLTEAYGPSGNEGPVREVIKKEVRACADSVRTDVLGNLIVHRKAFGKRPRGLRIMLAAHMDEIGLIATHIDDNGFVRFSNIGHINVNNVLAQRVVFQNGTVGVIGEERQDAPGTIRRLDRMFLDVGAKNRKEALALVSVGDVAAFQQPCRFLGGRVVAKSMDNRIGCAVLVEVLRRLRRSPHHLWFVFTTQEEVGLRGATTAAFDVAPDLGLAVDITGAFDVPEEKPKLPSVLGKGAAIKIKDAGILAHPTVKNLLIDTARKRRLPYQMDILEAGTTDGSAIYKTRSGIPTGVVSIPTRYGHSASEMVDLIDVQAVVNLLVAFLSRDLRELKG